jgi:O-antigen ligase
MVDEGPLPPGMVAYAGDNQYAHNFFIETLLEAGLLAFVAVVVLTFISFKGVRSIEGYSGTLLFSIWLFALTVSSLSGDLARNRLLWVMLGAGLIFRAVRDRKSSEVCVTPASVK